MSPRLTENSVEFNGYGENMTSEANQQTFADVTGTISKSGAIAADRALSKNNTVRSVNHDVSTGAFKKVSKRLTGWRGHESWYRELAL